MTAPEQYDSEKIGLVSPEIRNGLVELDSVALTKRPIMEESKVLTDSAEKLHASQKIVEQYYDNDSVSLDQRLTRILNDLLDTGNVDGLMIATEDGLVIAESISIEHSDMLAAICSISLATALRVEREKLVDNVEELSIRGGKGESLIARMFPGVGLRYFLIAYMKNRCAYRRITNQALRACGALLEERHN